MSACNGIMLRPVPAASSRNHATLQLQAGLLAQRAVLGMMEAGALPAMWMVNAQVRRRDFTVAHSAHRWL